MKQINIFTYSSDLALSNKYLKVIIKFLNPKIFNEKAEVLFNEINKFEKDFSLNILDLRQSMTTFKFQFDTTNPRLIASTFI